MAYFHFLFELNAAQILALTLALAIAAVACFPVKSKIENRKSKILP